MSVLDTETAVMLREAARKHAERTRDLLALRARRGQVPNLAPGHLPALRAQGWLDAFVPEDHGGMALGLQAAAVLVRELAPAFGVAPLDSHFLACRALTLAGGWDALDTGDARAQAPVLSLAVQETTGDLFQPDGARAVLSGGRVSGVKRHVAGLEAAEVIVLSAQGPDGLTLVGVDAGGAGVVSRTLWRADGTPIGQLELSDAPARVLASGAGVGAAIAAAIDETSALVAVELMAHVDAMMDLVLDHLRRREQFGQPIGAFQALQHRAADLYVQQLLSRSVLDAVLPALDAAPGPEPRALLVARLRARLNATARLVAREGIQLFGAMGITDECDLGLHVKRVLALTGWLGSESQHRQRAARIMAAQLTDRDPRRPRNDP